MSIFGQTLKVDIVGDEVENVECMSSLLRAVFGGFCLFDVDGSLESMSSFWHAKKGSGWLRRAVCLAEF